MQWFAIDKTVNYHNTKGIQDWKWSHFSWILHILFPLRRNKLTLKKRISNRFSFVTVVHLQLVIATYTSAGLFIVSDSESSYETLSGRIKLLTLHNRRLQDVALAMFKGKSYLYPDCNIRLLLFFTIALFKT